MFTIADLGVVPDYAGITPQSQRIDREVIIMDPRGVGHSRPSLACPEVERLALPSLGVRIDAAGMRSRVLTAVTACHDRLTQQGIDLASYDLDQSAADIEDLRTTLGIHTWGLSAHGTQSRVVLQYLRQYPQHVREVVLDSADFPQTDPFTEEINGTRRAVGQISAACAADHSCNARFPNLEQALTRVTSRLTRAPQVVVVPANAIRPSTPILFDGATFLRGLRDLLAYIPRDGVGPQIPAMIYHVLDSTSSSSLRPMADRMVGDQTWCDGYQPKCDELHPLTEGAMYSILCRDIEPFVNRGMLTKLTGDDPAYVEAFAHDPYLDVCARWNVAPADSTVSSPVRTDVPTLIFTGQFDPFGGLPIAQAAAVSFSHAWVIQVPSFGHNVLGPGECARSIRNAWVDHPSSPPADTTHCLHTLRLTFTTHPR
jgi:pimeloyl-ACP methyl ester carboxylesterase